MLLTISLWLAAAPTAADAKAFADHVNAELMKIWVRTSTADWVKETYITDDTERNAAALKEDEMAFLNQAIKESLQFKGLKLDPDVERTLYLLRVSQAAPAPADGQKRADLARILSKLDGMYGKGEWCGKDYEPGKNADEDKKRCRDLQALSAVLAKGGTYETQLEAWEGWHTISRDMRKDYARLVDLANEGAREIGFSNLGELWRSGYDMTPEDFEK